LALVPTAMIATAGEDNSEPWQYLHTESRLGGSSMRRMYRATGSFTWNATG
jgi:hypothetical protein